MDINKIKKYMHFLIQFYLSKSLIVILYSKESKKGLCTSEIKISLAHHSRESNEKLICILNISKKNAT